MHFKILAITEAEEGLFIDWQYQLGPNGDVMNRHTGPFAGSAEVTPYEDLRLWLAMNAESTERRKPATGIPDDIADLVGTPTDIAELKRRFQPQLDAHKARVAEAQQQNDEE